MDQVVLFDGVCKLCNVWSKFLIQNDQKRIFKLCSVQSNEGKAILTHFGLSTLSYDTMLYVDGSRCFQKSDAFIRVMAKLGYPWKIACGLFIVPKPLRNWLYDRIALNRYRLFGRNESCILPTPDHNSRFLNAKK
jgi:predicted DCC family thiol-disulfide oxidoreductase YuxK